MKNIIFCVLALLASVAFGQQTVNNFTVKTNLVVGNNIQGVTLNGYNIDAIATNSAANKLNITNGTAVNLTGSLTNVTVRGGITYELLDDADLEQTVDYGMALDVGLTSTSVRARARSVSTVSALVTLVDPATSDAFSYVNALSYATSGDGGGGSFQRVLYSTVSGLTGTNGMWFRSSVDPTYAWRRVWDGGPVSVLWFGAFPDDDVDDTTAVQAAIDFAQNPSYGPGSGSGEAVSAEVKLPAGRFDWSAITIEGLSALTGVAAQQYNYNNGTSIRQLGGVTNQPLITLNGLSTFTQPSVDGLALLGRQEANSFSKVAIASVTSRHQFTVATNSLPATNAAAVTLPYYGFCYFYASDGKKLGVGWVQTIDYTTGLVTLRDQTDWYATPESAGLLLDTTCKVIFTEPSTVGSNTGYWSAYAPAGNIGILVKGSGVARIRNCIVHNFNAGIVFEAGGITIPMENMSIRGCALFNLGGCKAAVTSDHIFQDLYLQGFYIGDYDLASSVSLTNKWYRSTPFAAYHLPYGAQVGIMIADACHWSGIQSADNCVNIQSLFSDNMSVGGWWIETLGGSAITNALNIDTWTMRPRFIAATEDGIYPLNSTNQVRGLYVPSTTTGTISAQVDKVGVFSVYGKVNNISTNPATRLLDSVFDFPATTQIGISQIMQNGLAASANVYGAQAGRVRRGGVRDDIASAANAGSGWFYTNSSTASYAVAGTHTLSFDANGLNIGRTTQTTAPISITGSAGGGPWISMSRTTGANQTYSFRGADNNFRLYDDTAGVYALWANSTAVGRQLYIGTGAGSATPAANSDLSAEFGSGTNVAGTTLSLIGDHSTGSANNANAIRLRVGVAGASGSTLQSLTDALVVEGDGDVRLPFNLEVSGTINLGNASDTTLARSAAGVVTIEGVKIATQPTTETLAYSTTTVTLTAGKGPNQSSALTCTNAFTLTFASVADNDGGTIWVHPAATNCTVTLTAPAYGPSGTTLTITGGTLGTNHTVLAWKATTVGGTNVVNVNALNYYR
jgi:hypothetical protein